MVDDTISWMDSWFSGTGGVRKAHEFFINRVGEWPWKPLVARSFLLPKHHFVLWLFAHAKLLTRGRLDFVEDKSCVLCKGEFETMVHLFFSVPFSSKKWDAIRDWLDTKKLIGSATTILHAFRGFYHGKSMLNKLRLLACAATIYQIWNARNRAIFENETTCVEETIKKIKILCLHCLPNAINVLQ
ncbi:uncharacterized protein LOC142520182 [Primulina tabacum]|uniref:uncharacterized protein LOC142520182 n=1 Tax=Primulina tabacum TaxID=48773 RepID=UPI003F59B85B